MNDLSPSPSLIIKTLPVGPLQCNCTLLGNQVTKKAVIIDPGGDEEILLQLILDQDLELMSIIHTHAHLDHFLASGKIGRLPRIRRTL